MTFRILALAVACACSTGAALAAPVFVNGIAIAGNSPDLSTDSGVNRRVGMFSDLYYDPNRNEWWALGDRGPGGGTLSYDTRVQQFKVDINPGTGVISNFQIVQTIKFTEGGNPFNGLAPNPTNVLGRAFDPEGFVVNPRNGKFLVSDEYGPSLYEFNRDGTLSRKFTTPANLIPRNGATNNFAGGDPEPNTAGRRTNRGFEGLAVTPDGKYSYAVLQNALLDDSTPPTGNSVWVRIVKFNNETGVAEKQIGYRLDTTGQGRGISAIVALNNDEFLVLERNNRGVGVPDAETTPATKLVYQINVAAASDISDLTNLGNGATLPLGRVAVTKTVTPFVNISGDTLPEFGNRQAEKWEGFAIGPKLPSGQFVMLAGTDNDFSITQVTGSTTQFDVYYKPSEPDDDNIRIQCDLGTFNNCLTIDDDGDVGGPFTGSTAGYELIPGLLYSYLSTGSDLAGYVAPAAVVAPPTWALALAGLGLLGFSRRGMR